MIQFDTTIRGHEVTVSASAFDGDLSTGLPIGPEEVWAESQDGEPFELTDEEVERLGIEATEIYMEPSEDDVI